jgi:hypothetical protein
MNELAGSPHSAPPEATIRGAVTALRSAAAQAPSQERARLIAAADAVRGLGVHGLAQAGHVETALRDAGHLLQRSCAFPVG